MGDHEHTMRIARRRLIQGALGATALLAMPGRLVAWPLVQDAVPSAAPPPDRYPPIVPRFPRILHGGDWNPDQWLHEPSVLEQDFALMEEAGCNTFSVGIFAWATLEPAEGRFEFGWLDVILDGLAARGWNAFLATPSGAKPRWMSEKYEEVRRVDAQDRRELHGSRHNHCFTSPVYREKVGLINAKLAERYRRHPALAGWHVSNEYSGACYCGHCLGAFRGWLQTRYESLEQLNRAYWSAFWSQTFQAWDQVDPRETPMDGLQLDWQRFTTHQTVDFMRHEIAPLKTATPHLPVTTNMMGTFAGLDYWRFADLSDRMSWDAYPRLRDWRDAVGLAMTHDMYRTMKGGLPFILMESTPSNTNWQQTPSLKQPGQHRQEMLLAIGHGADATMYFQWRKGRGAFEKTHGAVVDHEGSDRTRVFGDVAAHGRLLASLDAVVGTTVRPEVAVVNDWEVRWALAFTQGPRRGPGEWGAPFDKEYIPTLVDHYRPFWKLGISVDVIESLSAFDPYRLVVAPMLFMLKPGVADRLSAFVRSGGTLVLTYLSGVVNETELVFRGGLPGGGLRALAGVWAEEIDSLPPDAPRRLAAAAGNDLGLTGEHRVKDYCERVHAEGAAVLATVATGFFAGLPALTVNRVGAGRVYYLAARPAEDAFHDQFAAGLARTLALARNLEVGLPEGVTVQRRSGGGRTFLFLHNCTDREQALDLGATRLRDVGDGTVLTGATRLPPFLSRVVERVP
jgi:beta-galactosidase